VQVWLNYLANTMNETAIRLYGALLPVGVGLIRADYSKYGACSVNWRVDATL